MLTRTITRYNASLFCLIILASLSVFVHAEGSRTLYPASYPSASVATGARANLDLQPSQYYVNRIIRRGFIYVYAQAGEYILLGSSNIGTASGYGGDVNVYNPQDFGTRGDETIPATADFTCTGGSSAPGPHYSGANVGAIPTRAAELAGPNSADGTATVSNGYNPCGYLAPVSGVYGVLFTAASSGSISGNVNQVPPSNNSVAGWEVAVRNSAASITDIDGRVFTFAFLGFTGGNNRPVFSSLYYVTADGYRYQQDLRGLDPNGYALYANTFGFMDNSQPLYKTLRGDNATVSNLPLGISTVPAQFPIFFSDITPGAAAEAEAARVLTALDIPSVPPSPQIDNVGFSGSLGGSITSTGVGGTFSFSTTDTVSYQIVISRDGVDFDPANPLNRLLTGIAYSGVHQVVWDGLDNDLAAFPASVTPYTYRAYGRNGEVHFPIIDAENNGNATIAGGGPTITRLNGTSPGDRTVFFDDRGYVTSSGTAVGNLNGTLCPGATPAAASPPVSLAGVDSSTSYRRWQNGGNSNSDCATTAGWGDAKGVNLWTYFLTGTVNAALEIREFPVDLATSVTMPATATAGGTVQGTFSFANNGSNSADQISYGMSLSPGLGVVTFSNLPVGTAASYDSGTGIVTLTGFPGALAAGESYSGMLFSYTAPASGPITANTAIVTAGATADSVPQNNNAIASTAIGDVDVATAINGVAASGLTGSTVTGSVLFSNSGPQDAQGVSYLFSIGAPGNTPTNVQFSSLPSGVSATFDAATGVVSLTGMPTTLVVGDLLSISFSYTAPAIDGARIEVNSAVATTSDDAVAANNSASAATDFVLPVVDVATVINGVPASGLPGSTVTGSVVFSNAGPEDAQGVTYSLNIGAAGNTPGDVQFTSLPAGVSASIDAATGVVTLTGMPTTLAVGDSISLSFSYTAPATDGARIEVTSAVATTSNDVVPANNSASAGTDFLLPVVDVATVISGVPASGLPGSTVTGSVVFSNAGPEDAQGVTYSLSIGAAGNTPGDVQFTSLPPGVGATFDAATGVVTLTGMPTTLVVGDSISLDFSYTAPAADGARIEVTSAVATTSNDVVPANNSALASTDFALNPPIAPSIPVPVMPWPAYVLMLVLLAGVVRLRTRQIHH
jgi:hypothetical protein